MAVFSQRNGYNNKGIELETVSEILKRKIYAAFYKEEYYIYDLMDQATTGIEDMMIEMGITYRYPENRIYKEENAKKLENQIINSKEWYTIFDFIERYLAICDEDKAIKMKEVFNHILEDEVSAYRIFDKKRVTILK